ncbi:hypothetical protein [Brevibacillus dissolubilis]|uniref:hypothetical protein n=1 Tax=Brevibacillus dissolubilis TaxID=1844116 RepID=UPI0011172168|nr:hypothetical protein [Brevibacillus dissolubilis]
MTNQNNSHHPWKYNHLEKVAKTGDLIFANGTSPGSKIIERVSDGEWSHVGMIIRKADLHLAGFTPSASLPDLLVLESTDLDNLPDIVTGTYKAGVMLVPLQDRFYTDVAGDLDEATFGYRPYQCVGQPASDTSNLTTEQLTRLTNFISYVHGTPQASHVRMMGEYGAGLIGLYVSMETYFCSKLIAQAYIAMGLLPSTTVPNGLSPDDFANSTTPASPDDDTNTKGTLKLLFGSLGQFHYVAAPLSPATESVHST